MQRCWMLWKSDDESVQRLLVLAGFDIALCRDCPLRLGHLNCWDIGSCQAWRCKRYPSCDSCPIYESHRLEAGQIRHALTESRTGGSAETNSQGGDS